jgi:hypothetical protein
MLPTRRCVMTEKDPDGEPIEQETAVPLPERDAMSIIGGGPQPLPVVGPTAPITIDPPSPD